MTTVTFELTKELRPQNTVMKARDHGLQVTGKAYAVQSMATGEMFDIRCIGRDRLRIVSPRGQGKTNYYSKGSVFRFYNDAVNTEPINPPGLTTTASGIILN